MELAEAAKKLKEAKSAYNDCQTARQQLIDNLKKLAEILENQEQYSRQLIFSIGEHKVQTSKGDVHFPKKMIFIRHLRTAKIYAKT